MSRTSQSSAHFWQALSTQRLVLLIFFALLFALATRAPVDTDTWWHLRTGKLILETGTPPRTDTFSHTRYGQSWDYIGWLAQVAMTLSYRLLGEAGLALLTAALALLGMWLVWQVCEGDVFTRAFAVLIGATAAAIFWSARPQMFSFVFAALLLYLLHRFKREGKDQLWLIVPLSAIWVNTHPGYFIAFILLGGFIAGEILGKLLNALETPALTWRQIGKLIVIALLSYLMLVLNPSGATAWTYAFRTFGIGVLQNYIQEWASPDFHRRETWPFLALLLATFAMVGLSRRRHDLTDLLLFCGTAFMAFYAGRNISLFALVAVPILTRHVNAFREQHGLRLPKARPPKGAALILNWLLLALIVSGAVLKIWVELNPSAIRRAQAERLPLGVVAYLNQARPQGAMFNSYNWGGYLLFAAPDFPVFVDGRTDLYDDELLSEWLRAYTGVAWRDVFTRWSIALVVLERDSTLAAILRDAPEWRETYSDAIGAVFERRLTSAGQ
ncbi:MAG: hypothetical protein CUN49_05500 [Candidatus Thermofonsia Clade 1 bacterium]|jgi:hypothetical protein|uniref:Glycosyltransferase RgtA/B/C/D-like domain-containing protein n=1 Tax=Candidatus Thermofonsia Clade 1 bacterium TaxID=2364210 RepID=A0A2M8Q0V6_9CHLR|nr:MAG: hypothetical protein CUN49_05500 [Candidatus Thermofonsia Clade 1 bacterium]PJF43422.1 MAG: hypothetical protein CUN50_00420 [Candidatus Thermofonsia Clade 1 bacterium]RMF49354.1 MAG: hypothetical protein D6749_13465 [Chloroflexota bacterium]